MKNFNPRSEKSLIQLFPTLPPVQSFAGVYTSELPGPTSLFFLKRLFLTVSGLPGWTGKKFMQHNAFNLLMRDGKIKQGPIMNLSVRHSSVDGRPGLVATYNSAAPFMWRHCTDEFRKVNETTVLGMSKFDLPGLRGLPIMFILHRDPSKDGILG